MAERRPLVHIDGRVRELRIGDTIPSGAEPLGHLDIIRVQAWLHPDRQLIIREELVIEGNAELVVDGRLYIEN